jgi:very-short-patch-repair endonuclease
MGPEAWAEQRDGLLTTSVVRTSVSRRQMTQRKQQGLWRPTRRGVFAVGGSPRSWQQEVRAVLLSCGPDVVASWWTAGRMHGGTVPEDRQDGIHVSGSLHRMVRMDGVTHHRSGTFVDDDIVERHGMRCTSTVRTVIDVSGSLSIQQLGAMVDDFLRRTVMRLGDLRTRVGELRPAPGRSIKKLRAVLAARIPGYDAGDSHLETRIALLIESGRIRRPAQQFKISFGTTRYRLDFAYPDEKIYLEGNGFGCHSIASDLDKDARRQNAMVIDGWRPVELTWRMTDSEILATLRAFGLAA